MISHTTYEGKQFMSVAKRFAVAFLSVCLMIGLQVGGRACADNVLKIGDGDGFLLKCTEIIETYNNLMSGKDPNYQDSDELLKIRVDNYGKSYFASFISVKKSTNQFAVYFNVADELIQDYHDDAVPELILIFTKGRKELVEQDESIQMLPDLMAAFSYLCDPEITDSASARERAEKIMEVSSETHDWVSFGGMDYYCIASPMKEADGHLSMNLTVAIKPHDAVTSYRPVF